MNNLWQKVAIFGATTTAVIATSLIGADFASAQISEVYCESNNYQRQSCPIDTRSGVEIINQRSKISCDGKWGVGKGFVWVEDGCRASFKPLRGTKQNVQYERGRGDRWDDRYERDERGRRDRWDDRYGRDERYDRDDRDYGRRNSRDSYEELNNIYREILDRDIDRQGQRTYTERLRNGWSLSRVRRDVANSNEAKTAINRLFQEALGRDADAKGLRTYQRWLADGRSLDQVRRDIKNSREARDRN